MHDRDSIFGNSLARRVESMGIKEVVTAPGSPWQNPFCEPLIGSIRPECLVMGRAGGTLGVAASARLRVAPLEL